MLNNNLNIYIGVSAMAKLKRPIEKYLEKFSKPEIGFDRNDEGIEVAYIYTDRFAAESLYSSKENYDDFSEKVKTLYNVTFADPIVMEKFASGSTRTKEQFESTVKLQSLRCGNQYPFSAFVVFDKSKDNVVGYEVIGNGEKEHSGELAYLFNKNYHRSETIKDVGYENVGALVLEYGAEQYKRCSMINQKYNQEISKFEGGQFFKKLEATSRTDNPGSSKILENLGFKNIGDSFKFGHDRYVWEKDYEAEDVQLVGYEQSDHSF
jgi:hypothetical protein